MEKDFSLNKDINATKLSIFKELFEYHNIVLAFDLIIRVLGILDFYLEIIS